MRFYEKAMRNASLILFWSALALFAGSLLLSAAVYDQQMQYAGTEIPARTDSRDAIWQVLTAVVNAWNVALFPFFGSAFLWALQKRPAIAGGAE